MEKKNLSILIKFQLMQYDKNGEIGRFIYKEKDQGVLNIPYVECVCFTLGPRSNWIPKLFGCYKV